MAESDVESILREIRERVLSQQPAGDDVAGYATLDYEGNGASDSGRGGEPIRQRDSKVVAAEDLALINSYLTTTARAWDRLPPLVSNRSGVAARVELWVKRNLKRATRWYSWEQVNFNAAVHHALRDMRRVLSAHDQELGKLRAEKEQDRAAFAQRKAEMMARHDELRVAIRSELRDEIARIQGELEAQRAAADAQRKTTAAQMEAQRAELNSRLAELDERNERLQSEQRVSFKQLSLETSEAAILEDRARRKIETLLEELKSRVEKLEKTSHE